jgi:hypothetical protein
MTRLPLGIGVVLAFVAAACGYTDAGVGTRTLEIRAALHYDWRTDATTADVWLTRSGYTVDDANVVLVDADSRLLRPAVTAVAAGHYAVTITGYPRRLQLSVRAGDDALTCQIEGPGRHVIATPAPGTVVTYGEPLPVRWVTEDGVRADSVTVSLEQTAWSVRIVDDQGHTAVPAQVLTPGVQTLTVQRHSHMVPSGASGHSYVDVAYTVSTPVQVRMKG